MMESFDIGVDLLLKLAPKAGPEISIRMKTKRINNFLKFEQSLGSLQYLSFASEDISGLSRGKFDTEADYASISKKSCWL